MKIAIIGNGISAIYNNNGTFIDSCDMVIRMNRHYIEGYEQFIGSKIDIISLMITGEGATSGIIGFPTLSKYIPLSKEIWIPDKCREEHQANRQRFLDYFLTVKGFNFVPDDVYDNLHMKMEKIMTALDYCGLDHYYPDSGMTNIERVIKEYPEAEIYVTGFDPNRRYPYKYYWELNSPKSEALNYHPQIAEGILFEHYKRIGKVREI